MIEKIRRRLPKGCREHLKVLTARKVLFTSLISISMKIFLLPKSRNECILIPLNKNSPRLFVIPDIYAVDCFHDIFIKEIYEKYRTVQTGDVVIDIGAHVGMFTLKAAKKVGDSGLVVAIEPEERNLRLLKKNVKSLKNVKIVPKAVGAFNGVAELIVSELSGTHQLSLYPYPENPRDKKAVSIATLDNIIQEFEL